MRTFQSVRQSARSDAFLSSDRDDRLRDLLSPLNLPALPTGGSKVRLIAIGNPAAVMEIINRLHRIGIEVPMWTPAQPIPNTDEVVRIYSENRSV